jgi:hypothetical protein
MEGSHRALEAKAKSPRMAVKRSRSLRKEVLKLECRRVAELVVNARTPAERDDAMQQMERYVATGHPELASIDVRTGRWRPATAWAAIRRSWILRAEMAKLECRRVAESVVNARTRSERDAAVQQAAKYVATGQMANWKEEYELEEAVGRFVNAKTPTERTDAVWDYITKGEKRQD